MQSIRQLFKIGPGPSSSHTIGPKLACEAFINEFGESDKYEVTLYGSLSLTAKGHGTDSIMTKVLGDGKVDFIFNDESLPRHPNALDIKDDKGNFYRVYSIGGGTIEIEGQEHLLEKIYDVDTWNGTIKKLKSTNQSLIDYIESVEGEEIWDYLQKVSDAMMTSIDTGIEQGEGKLVEDGNFKVKRKAHKIYEAANAENNTETKQRLLVAAYAHAVSEGSAIGYEMVTAPTCGACGVLPAVYKYALSKYKPSKRKALEGLAIAAHIGNIIKHQASISGAEGGCQAEIGSATSMAAAMLVYLQGHNNDVIEYAALSAMEHSLGLTCDPIEGYVMVPCIERNAVYALKAIDVAAISKVISGDGILSLDTVIKTMKITGDDIKSEYRETSKGGLAVTWCESMPK